MEPGEQTGGLYDYLYKDNERIASYYAQLFSGRLTSLEESDTTRDSEERTVKGTAAIVGGELKSTGETSSSSRRLIDPHDLLTSDVLSAFATRKVLQSDLAGAPHGSLVIAQGTMVLVDSLMIELAATAMEAEIQQERAKPAKAQNRDTITQGKLAVDALRKMRVPSGFLLMTSDGVELVGTIKDPGMQEPISTYYFKHGIAGLADVYLIGIKETPSHTFTLPDNQIIGAGQLAAHFLSQMLFPPDAIRTTPIALFRKLW